jgi:cell division septal protein FtsQ
VRRDVKKVRRFSALRSLLKWFIICFLISGTIWLVFFSPIFRITSVKIYGLDGHKYPVFISDDKITSIKERFSENANNSLILFSTKALEEEISSIHGVAATSVAKVWPNSLVIMIEPRIPLVREKDVLVDIEGVRLGKKPDNYKGSEIYPEMITNQDAEHDTLLIYNAIKSEGLNIKKIESTSRDNITIEQDNGFKIMFGNINQLGLKLADVHKVLDSDIIKDKKILDVSAPVSPVVK